MIVASVSVRSDGTSVPKIGCARSSRQRDGRFVLLLGEPIGTTITVVVQPCPSTLKIMSTAWLVHRKSPVVVDLLELRESNDDDLRVKPDGRLSWQRRAVPVNHDFDVVVKSL